MFSENKTQYRDLQNFVAKFYEISLKFPKPNKVFIIQFIFSIHSLGSAASSFGSFPDDLGALVVIDWDDTLFPTSWQNRAFPQSSAEYAECVEA